MGGGNASVGDPQIRKWNPILLWLWGHGWEDPDWGRFPINQVTIGLAVYELAASIRDDGARKSIQEVAGKVVAKSSLSIVNVKDSL